MLGEFSITRVDDSDIVLALRVVGEVTQPLRMASIAESALAASAFTSAPPEMATIMSGRMLLASTAAQFSLDGTNRLFCAAFACAVAASLPLIPPSNDFSAGIVSWSANCF